MSIMSRPSFYQRHLIQRNLIQYKPWRGMPALLLLPMLASCTPTVQVAMPNEPITINLNVRIEHEIRVKVERELDDIFSADSGLF
jgi:hypothetical protein